MIPTVIMAMEVLGGSCPSGFISCGRDSRRAVGVLAAREIRSIIAIAITAKMAAKTSTAMWGSALAASPMLRHLNAVHHHHHPPVGYSICLIALFKESNKKEVVVMMKSI